MKKILLNKFFLFSLISIIGISKTNAQLDIEYAFEGTTFEGWQPQGGTGAFVSTFANNPNGALEISWTPGANTKNVIMYGPAEVATLDADAYKFMQVKISNTSAQMDIMRIRVRVAGGSFSNAIDVPITVDAAGVFSTYNFEITNPGFTGMLDRFQIVFRRSDGDVIIDDMATIEVDNILVSTSTTLSTPQFNTFEFETFPNPVKNKFNIRTTETLDKVEILDLLGRTVKTINTPTQSIDVSTLKSAIYIVRLTSKKGSSTKKFVKE